MPFEGYFIDAGTPQSYLEANFKLCEDSIKLNTAKLSKNRALMVKVVIMLWLNKYADEIEKNVSVTIIW